MKLLLPSLTTSISVGLLLSLLLTKPASAFTSPGTTGQFATGVRDAEFIDFDYPSQFKADEQGRRIMYRMWYPTCAKSDLKTINDTAVCEEDAGSSVNLGRRRLFLEPGEWEAYFGGPDEPEFLETFDPMQSYLNAPPTNGDFPIVIYSHGFGMWVSDNGALMEEIASQGYTVFAVGSPGFTSGVLYPSDQQIVHSYVEYPEVNETLSRDDTTNPLAEPYTSDLQVRYDRQLLVLEEGAMPLLTIRLRDDMLAMVDHISNSIGTAASAASSPTRAAGSESFLQELLGAEGIIDQLVFMGFSLGGAASASAAQMDPRAVGAINIDGSHQSVDLFGKETRVPFLTFFQNTDLARYYYNEFFFEELESMGTRSDVTRVFAPPETSHLDFTDYMHLPADVRAELGMPPIDGGRLHSILSEFCVGFLNTYLKGSNDWDPEVSFSQFEDIEPVDVSYVADWADSRKVDIGGTSSPSVPDASSSSHTWKTAAKGAVSITLAVFVYVVTLI